MSDFVGATFIALLAGSAAIGAGRKIIERRRARRELRQKPPLDAASPEGETVRVTGVVRVAEDTLVAPLSGRTCVVARSQVTIGYRLTSRAMRPQELVQMVPFVLDRGSDGIVRVEGHHVLLDLRPLPRRELERGRREHFLVLQGYTVRDARRAIFAETLVEPGDRVSVSGLVMKDLSSEPPREELGFREPVPTSIRIAGNAEHPLAIGEPIDA